MAKANDTTATTASTTETSEVEGVRVEQIDPATLLIDVNVRTETVADKDFVASVKDLGVLQPIRAVRTSDGGLRVETGHRCTLAAVEAGLATVPVLVVADERTDDAGTVERIVRQYAENEHRTGLTTTDRLGVVEQLSLLNVSAAQIAKRTRMKRPQVDQALAVTRSDLAKAASVRYDLTLDQAAGVAEFEDDTEIVKALVAAARSGQFDHVLERARQDRDDADQRTQAEAELAATGVRVIAAPEWGEAAKPLGWNVRNADRHELAAGEHTTCPGHVAWVEQDWVNVTDDGHVYTDADLAALPAEQADDLETREERRWMPLYGCEDAQLHHPRPGTTSTATDSSGDAAGESDEAAAVRAETASAERRRVIAGNKAWDAVLLTALRNPP